MFAWVLLCCLEGTAAVQVSCFRGREKMGRRIESWEGAGGREEERREKKANCYPAMYAPMLTITSSLTHTHTHTKQAYFWKYLNRPSSEKFFHEIHNRFQEAQTEIKNCPMGLVIEHQGDSTRMVVSQPSVESSGGGGQKKPNRGMLVSQLSMEQRDLQVRECN